MKKTIAIIATMLLIPSLALANGWDHRGGRHGGYHGHHHGNRHGSTVAAIAGLAVLGTAIYAATRPPVVVSPPVYVPPAPPPTAPNMWYFCASSGAYYPYVHACPEGWQAVVPAPY